MAMTLKDKIVALKTNNPDLTAKQIADKLKTKVQYVYTTLYLAKKGDAVAKPKRKAKKDNPFTPIAEALGERVQAGLSEASLAALRNQNSALRKEIDELTTIIAYLEHRCYRAESKNGAPV